MKKMKTPGGLGALLLLMALIATGCLEQPGSDWVNTQPKEQPVVIIDGTGENQERPAPHVPRRIPTAPPTTHLTTPLATSPKEVPERDTRIASPAPAEQVVTQSSVIRENASPVSSGAAAVSAGSLRWIDPDEKSPAEAYISSHGGMQNQAVIGDCTFTVVSGGVIVIHDYPSTLSFYNIQEVCASHLSGYTFLNQITFVVATPKP